MHILRSQAWYAGAESLERIGKEDSKFQRLNSKRWNLEFCYLEFPVRVNTFPDPIILHTYLHLLL